MKKDKLIKIMIIFDIWLIIYPFVFEWLPTVDYDKGILFIFFTVFVMPIIYLIFLIFNIIFIFSKKKLVYLFVVLISIIAAFISVSLLTSNIPRDFVLKLNYYFKYNKRMEVIDKIRHNEISINNSGIVELPSKYHDVGYNGIVYYEEINEGYIVEFVYLIGGEAVREYIVYFDKGDSLIREIYTYAETIEQIDDNWFYIVE